MSTAVAMQVVTFRLGEDRFAVDIQVVERVLRYQEPTVVPKLPDWVEGVLHYQSRVIPVLDLRRRFSVEGLSPRTETRILVLSAGEQWIGVVVDSVMGVESLGADQLSPPPALFRGLSAEYLRGIAKHDDILLIVLDTDRLLTSTERIVLEQMQTAANG
ncbi:MAG TPA: chemotaxis protein CheW [Gemmatimonadaceae bacterium]|nr:chemotaxis protein CheW [Gemmatimonadaceae bacterium]